MPPASWRPPARDPNVAGEPWLRDHVDRDAEELLERELHAHEIDQASALFEADQQIEIAIRPRVFAGPRAEDAHVAGPVSARDAQDRFDRKRGHGKEGSAHEAGAR